MGFRAYRVGFRKGNLGFRKLTEKLLTEDFAQMYLLKISDIALNGFNK